MPDQRAATKAAVDRLASRGSRRARSHRVINGCSAVEVDQVCGPGAQVVDPAATIPRRLAGRR